MLHALDIFIYKNWDSQLITINWIVALWIEIKSSSTWRFPPLFNHWNTASDALMLVSSADTDRPQGKWRILPVRLPDMSRVEQWGWARTWECTWKATGGEKKKQQKKKICRILADLVSDGRMGRSDRLKEKRTDCRKTRQTLDRRSPHSITSDQPHITHLIYLPLLLSASPLRLPFLLPTTLVSPLFTSPSPLCVLSGRGCLVESEGSGCVHGIMFGPRQGAWNTCFGSLRCSLKYVKVGQKVLLKDQVMLHFSLSFLF